MKRQLMPRNKVKRRLMPPCANLYPLQEACEPLATKVQYGAHLHPCSDMYIYPSRRRLQVIFTGDICMVQDPEFPRAT
jgi:hypothetical protein